MTTQSANLRTRFIFDDQPVRGLHVQLQSVWQHIVQRKPYPAAIRSALGELLAAGVLLSSNLKLPGKLILQIQGQGDLKMLVAETDSNHSCRATARWNEQANLDDGRSLIDLLGENAVFGITLQPNEGEPWQGIVPLEGSNIAEMLSAYMRRSEQLDTHISLAASEHAALADTVTPQELIELDAQHLLYRLFHETPPRVFEPEQIEFACTCSRGKVSDMLLLLGGQEGGNIVAEQGSIAIDCDFCGEKYVFDDTDVQALFGMEIEAMTGQQLQ